jgi:hypothetical protein
MGAGCSVDSWRPVAERGVSFPSHATEFGHDGDLVVDDSIDGDVVAFDVALHAQCPASALMRMPGLFPRSRPVRGSAARCRRAQRQRNKIINSALRPLLKDRG